MSTLSLPSPAKINLFLHITGQRSDGYHNLQTLFQLLDFGDKLVFRSNRSGNIKINGNIDGVDEKNNLIFHAATLLQKSTGCDLGCTIDLTKNLPMGAGLGGGSSNAATTLVGLNALWKCGLTANQLSDLGKTLGADVPVFVHGESAFAEGIGDILTPLTLPQRWFLVITPNCHVSTREIFSNPQLTRNSSPIKIRALSGVEYRNDCQDVVSKLYPAVRTVLQWVENFSAPLMTGTGASVFCSFDSKSEAQHVLSKLPKQWTGFVAKGVNRSPVHEQLHDFFTGASPSG
ncbi:MAG: 4-(cytidine 5'-diphospho)-2-C-methyl-D-erythritol kinase [Porticoccaceae bacterium]|jgi:4-diphosphocytidyl-2-C-methyl-D-erythritol kinase|nr:4-(cytidine 5'-diphospho)-2-C-methyl-D-erythritol kinase [Porticoccaceae bacterium]MBT5070948.1 4-(cytidine 5'-diphospho)-2-C-methyl-D-erythritol kinase [Porticoccaceae bacterium]MBT6779971.1 4-(cytidine 5'-diphospho)-2-C-methyl-D-erythritol kinase [Porticoccaceae bacterium]MDC3199847.1 4-(cytidine 5'-diphospho)-2-C-methyl-D-erythritol kinase [Porticoccaceae bacterium]